MTLNLIPWWAYAAAGAVAGALLAGGVQQARVANAQADVAQRDTQMSNLRADLASASDKARADADAARQAKADAVAAVDAQKQKELTDARKENDRLRAAVRVSADSLRIVGAYCPSPADPVPPATGASGMGDAAPKLDAALRERVLDLRQAVIEAEKQIEYLQGYAREASKPPALPASGPTPVSARP